MMAVRAAPAPGSGADFGRHGRLPVLEMVCVLAWVSTYAEKYAKLLQWHTLRFVPFTV